MDAYNIGEAFKVIEDELIASMIRNMRRHRVEETKEAMQWTMWQAEQLQALEQYKKANKAKYGKQFIDINKSIKELITQAHKTGGMEQEKEILQAVKKGYSFQGKTKMTGEFMKVNDRKLNALINATTNDVKRAETAVLRMANDKYRKIIFNAQVYANAGGTTYVKAVDMATKDFVAEGIKCIEYKNKDGKTVARHRISDYADMAIRTANKRAYLQGEGEKRKEWNISTVIVNKRGSPCPKCLPFCGKVFIDDVWSGGKASDGPYPLLSGAISAGLYHPRCKDAHTTYFEGISTPPSQQKFKKEEIDKITEDYKQEQRAQYAERQEERYARLAKYSLDKDNKRIAQARADEWHDRAESLNEASTLQNSQKSAIINKINKTPEPPKFSDFEKPVDYAKAKLEWEKQYKSLYEKQSVKGSVNSTKVNKGFSKQLSPMNDDDMLKQVMTDTGMDKDRAVEVIDSLQSYTGSYYKSIRNLDLNTPGVVSKRNDIEEFISKSPSYDGKIYRGIRMKDDDDAKKFLSNLNVDNTIDMEGISSWSSNEKIALDFADGGEYKPIGIIFECENKSGVGIQYLSTASHESEVIQSAMTKFKITEIKVSGNQYRVKVVEK